MSDIGAMPLIAVMLSNLMAIGKMRPYTRFKPSDYDPIDENMVRKYKFFESDMKVSAHVIMNHYKIDGLSEGWEIRKNFEEEAKYEYSDRFESDSTRFQIVAKAVYQKYIKIWNDKTIPYKIARDLNLEKVKQIGLAINHWEQNTCLKFVPARDHEDYIEFINHPACWSSVGRVGGRQEAGVGGCRDDGFIVHEIGHSLGFWHEQSRPDRDQYIHINKSNVNKGMLINFIKQKAHMIDYQASPYDYGSIMHYHPQTFSKYRCPETECAVITVNNLGHYVGLGNPYIGQRRGLSKLDVEQANRLYSCPNNGTVGYLYVKVVNGTFETDLEDGAPNPYVVIVAVDSKGKEYTQQTSRKGTTYYPNWNQMFNFGNKEWQFFRISAWNTYIGTEGNQMTMSQTISLKAGKYLNKKHCASTDCKSHVVYSHYLIQSARKKSSAIGAGLFTSHIFSLVCFCISFLDSIINISAV